MTTEDNHHRLLKDLALDFKSSKDVKVFNEIVKIVNKLLYSVIHKARRNRPYLKKVEIEDLYQDAILGLYQALDTVKEDEPGSKIIYRIDRYAYNAIGKNNKHNGIGKCNKQSRYKVTFPFGVAGIFFQVSINYADIMSGLSVKYMGEIEQILVENTLVYAELESKYLRDRFSKLIEEDIISIEEFVMISMHCAHEKTYTHIAKQFGTSVATVSRKITKALNRLRFEFRRRNWEGAN